MRIRELQLIRYGKFTERTLDLPATERDIHLIVGPNEAGKSTARAAISDWLFGIPARTPLAFLHPMPTLRLGGVLEHPASQKTAAARLAFDRTKGNKNTLRTPQDDILPDDVLQAWLQGLQADAFNRMYSLDHQTLIEGGQGILDASDDVGRMLFQSAAGMQHLGQLLQQLGNEADTLWAPRKAGARVYYKARDAYDAALDDLKAAALRTRDWKARQDDLTQTQTALSDARQQAGDIRRRISHLERIRRVTPLLQALDTARSQRDQLLADGEVPLLPQNAAQTLAESRHTLAVAHEKLLHLRQDIAQAQAQFDKLSVDQDTLARSAEITELNERRLQYRAHRSDMIKRKEEIRVLWQQALDLAADFPKLASLPDDEDAIRRQLPAMPLRARLDRLLKTRGQAAEKRHAAQTRLAHGQQQIQKARRMLEDLNTRHAAPSLATALEQAHRLGDHDAALQDGQQAADALAQRVEAALAALGGCRAWDVESEKWPQRGQFLPDSQSHSPAMGQEDGEKWTAAAVLQPTFPKPNSLLRGWRKTPEALASMLAPDPAVIRNLQEAHRSDSLDLAALNQTISSKTQDIRRLDLSLQQLVQTYQPISSDQVLQARHDRDLAWQAIKAAPDTLISQAPVLETHLAQADQLADARHDRAEHEARRQQQTAHLAQQQLELSGLTERQQALQAQMQARQAHWQALATACGLPGLPLEAAASWLQRRQDALALTQEHAAILRQLQARRQAAEAARQALWASLSIEAADQEPPSLAECMLQARLVLQAEAQAQGKREALQQQLTQWIDDLPTLQTEAETAQAAWDQWHQAWQAAVLEAGHEADISPEQIETELKTLQAIEGLLNDIRRIRIDRIDAMQADLDDLAATAGSLARDLVPDMVDQTPEDIALALVRRLDDAEQARRLAAQLQAQLQKARSALADAETTERAELARLAPWMAAAGANDLDALAQAITRSDLLRALDARIADTLQALGESGDGQPEPQLRAEAAGMAPDTLKVQLEDLAEQARIREQGISELSSRQGAQQSAFDALDGSSLAAIAEARRQEAITDMAEAAQRYISLCTAARLLRWALERFRETRQGPLLACASAMFKTLTQDSFSRLIVDSEGSKPSLIGLRPSGEALDVDAMSEGTRDQLYLALRLAALQQQAEAGQRLPFIADDLFINFDDGRTLAGLQVLGELSLHLQVVVLTHHEHLIPLARKALGADLNVLRL